MFCKSCETANDDNAKFCKECGCKLDDAAAGGLKPEEHAKIGELIYAAYKYSELGQLDDAILACQGALALNERSASTHALLGSLYERRGDMASAIREYERVVALNPTSAADRRKLEDLKSGRMSVPASSRRSPRARQPYAPYLAAAVGFCFVLIIGLMFVVGGSEKGGATGKQPTGRSGAPPAAVWEQPGGRYEPATPGRPRTQQPTGAGVTGTQAAPRPKPGIAPVRPPIAAGPKQSAAPKPPEPPATAKQTPPIVPVIEPRQGSQPAAPSPRPAPPPPPKPTAPPVIVSTPAEPASNSEERGRQFQKQGKYQEAISAYREALNQTSDSGYVYQQIARCHQNLGQHDLAISTYSRAVQSYRDQLAAGRDPAEVQRAIRSCEAGIELSRSKVR